MSDALKQKDWTKPAAVAIPKGGYLKDKVEQGSLWSDLPQDSRVLRLLHHRENYSRPGAGLLRVCSEY
jgi:hypothetical protein